MKKPDLKVVSGELPDPPYPADVQARGYRLEIDWPVIKSSDTWKKCSPEQRNNLLRIWMESWNEIPCASWSADLEIVAISTDIPYGILEGFKQVLMRQWYLASDGRLYHPYLTSIVLKMLSKRRNSTERQRKFQSERKALGSPVTNALVTCESRVTNGAEQEQEQEQDKEEEKKKREKEKQKKIAVPSAARFAKPTPLEVQNYCNEKGYTFDAELFVEFYESKGWLVGKTPMKSWKSACATWSKRDHSNSTGEYNGKRYKNSTNIMFENIRKLDERRERERKASELRSEPAEKNVSELWSDIHK